MPWNRGNKLIAYDDLKRTMLSWRFHFLIYSQNAVKGKPFFLAWVDPCGCPVRKDQEYTCMLWSELINMTIDLQSYGDIKHRHDRSGEETCRNLHNYHYYWFDHFIKESGRRTASKLSRIRKIIIIIKKKMSKFYSWITQKLALSEN